MTQEEVNFKISDSALNRILEIKSKDGNADKNLRIKILGGGCSGFQYNFNLDDQVNEDDFQINKDQKLIAVIDKTSLDFLHNCSLDFVDNLGGSYFKIDNPNATGNCGCGSSFAI